MAKHRPRSPKIRGWVAVAAHFATGAGKHGGTAKQRNRRDRKKARRDLRDEV